MAHRKARPQREKQDEILGRLKQEQASRDQGYRERALALFPHVCGRCQREFVGKNLRELTVHHKDSDHMNNPPDGGNWELLCLYCHDDEHQDGDYLGRANPDSSQGPSLGFKAFEGLLDLVKPDEDEDGEV